MDAPSTDVEVKPEKIEDEEKKGPSFNCDLCDTGIVHKIAQAFLPGLATACVDNTSGDIFKTPGSVAVDIRTEMVDYLAQRSESFVAESVILVGDPEGEVSDHPFDIITDLVDDFGALKRNLFSRVSGWLLSEKREDKIDDFVQEMEISNFWLMDRREAIAQTLLKNVDFKNEFHCNMKFNSAEELAEHVHNCGFRSMHCTNEGCVLVFSANQMEKHDVECPFKIIPCEQNCSDSLLRREMDRHCITVCPMKLAKCPFYAVGCQSLVPQCMIEQHRSDDLHSHLLYILQGIHREASVEDLKKRVDQLEKSSFGNLADARDVRFLTFAVKDLEAKLGPLEVTAVRKVDEEGQVNEGEKISEEEKFKEEKNSEKKINGEESSKEGQANGEEKVIEEEKISEGGKVTEGGKGSEEGKVYKGGQVSEETKFNKERKVGDEENVIRGGKLGEQEKVVEEGKTGEEEAVCGGGNAGKVEKVTDGENAGEEEKGTEGGKNGEEGNDSEEEEKLSEEGKKFIEEVEVSGGKLGEEGKDSEEEKLSEETKKNIEEVESEGGKLGEEGNDSGEEKLSEGKKIIEREKVSEGGKLEAGKATEEGKVSED